MSRPEFENQTMISAVSSKTIQVIEGESVQSLAPGVSERITIYAPPNKISRVFNMAAVWYAETEGITSGTKNYIVDMMKDTTSGIGMWNMAGAYKTKLSWDAGTMGAGNTFNPNDLSAMSNQINAIRFDESKGMQLAFIHNFNLATVSKRYWCIFVEEEVVSR